MRNKKPIPKPLKDESKPLWPKDESNPLWPNRMWLKDPEDLYRSQLQDHQNHPQENQNRLQGLQTRIYKEPPKGWLLVGGVLKPLEPILVFLVVFLVVLELVLM